MAKTKKGKTYYANWFEKLSPERPRIGPAPAARESGGWARGLPAA